MNLTNTRLILTFILGFFISISIVNGQGGIEYRKKRTKKKAGAQLPSGQRTTVPPPATLMPQVTGINGTIIDDANAEALPEATIQIIKPEGYKIGALSDFEGKFALEKLKPGVYTLQINYFGYKTQTITDIIVEKGKITGVNIALRDESTALQTVVIESELRESSDAALLSTQRNAVEITDGVSSDMIRKETPDFQTMYILRRMPGVVFIEDKYLIIRGLFERYNLTTINGSPTPVSEFQRYTFDYNTIPASLLKKVQMVKTATANQYSDFAGGLVNFEFHDIPEQNSLKANVQFFYNNLTTGKDFYRYKGNTSNFGGLFTEYRQLPNNFPSAAEAVRYTPFEDKSIAAAKSLALNSNMTHTTALPSQNINFVWQRRFKIAKNEAGFSAALNVLNQVQNITMFRNVPDTLQENGSIPRLIDGYTSPILSEKTQNLNLIFNAGVKLGKKGKIALHNLFSNGLQQLTSQQNGAYYYPLYDDYFSYHFYAQRYTQFRFYSTQLMFEYHPTAKLQTKTRLFYSTMNRSEPAYWGFGYEPVSDDPKSYQYIDYDNYSNIRPSETQEHIGGGNTALILPDFLKIKGFDKLEIGVLGSIRDKRLDARRIKIATAGYFGGITNIDSVTLNESNANQLFSTKNIIRADGFAMQDVTDSTYNYHARTLNVAPYIMGDLQFGRHLSVNLGLRLENFYQKMTVNGVMTPGEYLITEKRYNDLLPSIHARYALNEKTNLRLSAGQTLSRPDAKDLSLFKYLSIFNGTRIIGNPNLKRTKITNLDARLEYFPSGLEIMSFSLFYKYFESPILQVMSSDATVTSLDVIPQNSPAAQAAGMEIEIRRSIGNLFKIEKLRTLFAYTNLAFLRSTDQSGDFSQLWKDGRQMQGLASVIINFGIIYQEPKSGFSAALFYNRGGQRLAMVGTKISPDIYELPRNILDLQIGRPIGKNLELRLALIDILQQPLRWVQIYNGRTDFKEGTDRDIISSNRGYQIMLGLTAKF